VLLAHGDSPGVIDVHPAHAGFPMWCCSAAKPSA
jgi:hypothetical protein